MMLPQIGDSGQQNLKKASVLVIGAGKRIRLSILSHSHGWSR
jgi:hypothetical protein